MQLKAWMVSGLAGDSQSHVALLRAVRPLLGSFFGRRLCSDAAAVEDLVQDVLVAVHERRGSYDRARPFLPWLYAIARYKWIDHLRQTHHHEPIEDLKDILEAEAFEPRSEARLDVASLLRRLPVKQARAIRHTRLQELSVAEAGRLAGIGESDVKVSAHRGIRTLIGRIAAAAA
jgi:RNA polymerase sigma-70 factor (ECF subfamily)